MGRDVGKLFRLAGFENVIQETLGDVDCNDLAVRTGGFCEQSREQAGASPDISDRHPRNDFRCRDDLISIGKDFAAFDLEFFQELGWGWLFERSINPRTNAFFLGRRSDCQGGYKTKNKRQADGLTLVGAGCFHVEKSHLVSITTTLSVRYGFDMNLLVSACNREVSE